MQCIGNAARAVTRGRRTLVPACTLTLLASSVALAVPSPASALSVYAAASLREAFPRIDGRPKFNFAGSNTLQLQIERGAPADVYASASPREPKALAKAGRCQTPRTFATNNLVVIVPKGNPAKIRSIYDLTRGGLGVAIGTPGVPVGAYSRRMLHRLALSDDLAKNKVSSESNVTGITAKVALGSADLGLAYVTDARLAGDRVERINLPTFARSQTRYDLCIVRRDGVDASGAKAFVDRVLSDRGRRLLRAEGFGVPARKKARK